MKNIIWFVIAILPVVIYLLSFINRINVSGNTIVASYSFSDILGWFGINSTNVITSTFEDLFNYLGLSDTYYISGYLTYWLFVKIAHICFDVISFLVDICHNFINKLEGVHDEDFF